MHHRCADGGSDPLTTVPLGVADDKLVVPERTWQGIPGLERTAQGRVFVSWFTGGAKEPDPENTVVLAYSDDAGKALTEPQEMAVPSGGIHKAKLKTATGVFDMQPPFPCRCSDAGLLEASSKPRSLYL